MHSFSHLRTAASLLGQYEGEEPFHLFLKKYFKQHPKHGSRDRRVIAQMCYSAFRLGKAARDRSLEEQILAGYFLCLQEPSAVIEQLRPEWAEFCTAPLITKLDRIDPALNLEQLFPWRNELSTSVDINALTNSFFQQPLLFLRVRPGFQTLVKEKLSSIKHEWISEDCVAVDNNTKVDALLPVNTAVVIQDRNSQALAEMLSHLKQQDGLSVWDCCAASGGKAILLWDRLQAARISVSDIRKSILQNLDTRMKEANVAIANRWVIDLASSTHVLPDIEFDLIWADVPCTGSGTWGRNPEQLYYFDSSAIAEYVKVQQQILLRVSQRLKKGGYLLYSTCSVFYRENEGQLQTLLAQNGWALIEQKLYTGYNQRADTLFAALLQRV